MTEQELDRAIRRLLIEAERSEEPEDGADVPFVPSAHYRRSLRAMCRNPLKWARERQRPVWKRLAQRAAMFLLAGSIGLAGLTAAVPSARAAVAAWAEEWYETHVVFRYNGESSADAFREFEISALPEGFVQTERFEVAGIVAETYMDEAGNVLLFEYVYMHDGALSTVDTEGSVISEIMVKDMGGYYFKAQGVDEFNTLIWFDEQERIKFALSGYFEETEMLHIAESVR